MEAKRTVQFVNRSETKSYEYEVSDIPRIGEYVTIFDNQRSGKSLLEGNVVRVRWVIVYSEREHGAHATVVLDEQPI